MKRIIKNSATSAKGTNPQSEYEYRKNIYLKRKHEYETLGEDNNNDVLSREEKMNIAKAEMDKVNPKSSNVKASEDDYNPYSFMVGDQLEWSGLYGGQYKGLVTNVNDEYVTVEVMRTAEDSGDTIIDTQKFEIVTDPEGKECIIVWTYGSHAGYVYPPYEDDPDDYINSADKYNVSDWKELASKSVNSAYEYSDDALWDVIDDEEFEFRGVQDVGYDNDGNIMVVFNHAISETMIEPTAEELLMAFRQYGYPVHEWNTNGANVFILSRGGILSSTDQDFNENSADKYNVSESSNVNNMKYWYFTKHGVQPGSIPKYVNVLDIIDKPEGSYFLTDTIINTNDLHEYEIKEAIPEDVDSCSEIEANYNVAIDKLHNELYNKIVKYGLSEGFPENEIDDYFFVTVLKAYDHIECEVRAEVDYEGLEALCDLLNPVVQKYEPAAYFEPVTSGIIEAYIYPTGKNKALFASKGSGDTHYMQLKRAYKNMRKFDDMDSQSADILDLEDELNSHDTPYERYEHTTDNGCTIFYDDYIKGQEFKNSDLTERETLYYKGKKFVVHYTVKDTYDAKEAFDSFKASISMIAPYDDADYYWARIYNGIIKYIYKGKVMRVNYYFNPEDMSDVDDWNLEDWYSGICDEVVQSLYESNKSIESKMVHN